METWKTCIECSDYEVSDHGRVRLVIDKRKYKRGHILSPCPNRNGYPVVGLTIDGKRKKLAVHRLVLGAFVGPRPEGKECAHWDGNPANNNLSNLRWATPAENTEDKIRHGNIYNGHRKFTADDVLAMRAMRAAGRTYKDIMAEYGISKGNLSAIINRQTWGHI